jgi:hypothetical protein
MTLRDLIGLIVAAIIGYWVIFKADWNTTITRVIEYKQCKLCFHRHDISIFRPDPFKNCENVFCLAKKSVCPVCNRCSICGKNQ